MKKALEVINSLEKEKIIEGYAMGGAAALLFYTEPALTFDIDIFIFLPSELSPKGLIDLSPLYDALKFKGYRAEKEHVVIEGIPVQFIPVYNSLVEEAVRQASIKKYEGTAFKVLKLEYLLAIMLDTNRPKDKERLGKLLNEVSFDQKKLKDILDRHFLRTKWETLFENQQKKHK